MFPPICRIPKKQPESISVNVGHKIPVVSSKTSLIRPGQVHDIAIETKTNQKKKEFQMQSSEPGRNTIVANLQQQSKASGLNKENSASLPQPKVG